MAGLSMVASVEGEGGSGEFSFCAAGGGGPKELSILVLEPDTIAHLCKGMVNGGVKFCLLPSDQCTIGAHTKKVSVDGSHVYINAGRNAAYTNPHIAAAALGPDLKVFLGELCPREDWLHIFQVYLDELTPQPSYKEFTTPKKRKYRYLPDPLDFQSDSMDTGLSSFISWDMELPEATKMLASMIQKLDTKMSDFQVVISEDVDSMFTKLQDLRAMVGTRPGDASLGIAEECTTVWETFSLLRSYILDPGAVHQLEQNLSAMESSITSMGGKVSTLEEGQKNLSELVQIISMEQDAISRALTQPGILRSTLGVGPQDLQVLQHRIAALEASGVNAHPAEWNTLTAQIKLLEARLPTDPFTIGGRTFNSKADVALFVE
jgi:hypothetical protein